MSRKVKTATFDKVELRSTELETCDALDLFADMMPFLAPTHGHYTEGTINAGEALGNLAREFTGGGLVKHLLRLLACTTLHDKEGKGSKVELIGESREKMNLAFGGRGKLLVPAVKLALEVSFKDFLEGLALAGLKLPKILSPSATSIPSTPDTGSSTEST